MPPLSAVFFAMSCLIFCIAAQTAHYTRSGGKKTSVFQRCGAHLKKQSREPGGLMPSECFFLHKRARVF